MTINGGLPPTERIQRRVQAVERHLAEDTFELSSARRKAAVILAAGSLASLAAATALAAVAPASTAHVASIVSGLVIGMASCKLADRAMQGAQNKTGLAMGMCATGIGTAFYVAGLTDGKPWVSGLAAGLTLLVSWGVGRALDTNRHHLPERLERFQQVAARFEEMEKLRICSQKPPDVTAL